MTKTLSSEIVYHGRVFDIRKDRIAETTPEGTSEYDREVITHNGSAVIVPLFADGTVALVKQYRHAAGKYLLELPAGSLDTPDEYPEHGAHRELAEEIGVTAAKMQLIAEFYVSPGFLSEKMFVYLATDLTETEQNLDEDEHVEIVRLPLDEALKLTQTGEIEDAKTIIGITRASQSRDQML
ncbi:MAG: NUDIX hydrolase [Pyrinomonadaceae bacterium]